MQSLYVTFYDSMTWIPKAHHSLHFFVNGMGLISLFSALSFEPCILQYSFVMISSCCYGYSSTEIHDMMPLAVYIKSMHSRTVQNDQNNDNSISWFVATLIFCSQKSHCQPPTEEQVHHFIGSFMRQTPRRPSDRPGSWRVELQAGFEHRWTFLAEKDVIQFSLLLFKIMFTMAFLFLSAIVLQIIFRLFHQAKMFCWWLGNSI